MPRPESRRSSRTEPALVFAAAALVGAGAIVLRIELGLVGLAVLPALLLTWAALSLGHRPAGRLAHTLRRRLPVVLLFVLGAAALLAGLAALPVWWLLRGGDVLAVLALSAAVATGWLLLWRIWPVCALALIDAPRATHIWPLVPKCWQAAHDIVAEDSKSGRGLLAALVLCLLVGVGPVLLWSTQHWDSTMRWLVGAAWIALFAPGLAYIYVALIEPARLAGRAASGWTATPARPAAPEPVAPAEPEGPPVLLPPDLDARLWASARLGRIDDALAAIEQGANATRMPAPEDRDQRSLAMLASIHPDTRLLRKLIALGVDLNHRQGDMTALLAATRDSLRGRADTVTTLLANGADPRAADGEGRTPLHFAALSSEPDVAALLIDAGAQLDAVNRDGFTPLGVACAHGNWRLARFLLERRAQVEPPSSQSALLAAASVEEDDPVGVELLLRHRAKVDHRSRLGRTALHAAALAGHVEISTALLHAGADANARDDAGITPLLEAARAGASGVIDLLAAHEVDVAATDRHGRNALVLACQSQRADAETVRALLRLGVDPAQHAGDGRSALQCAVGSGRWPLVAALDPAFPMPASMQTQSDQPPDEGAIVADDARPWREQLDDSLAAGEHWRARALLRLAAPPAEELVGYLAQQDRSFSRDALRLMLSGIELAWIERGDALSRAMSAGDYALTEALLDRGASCGGRGLLANWLQAVSERGANGEDETLALRMLGAGADGSGGRPPPLWWAARLGMTRLVRLLLVRGAPPAARDALGRTALHAACLGNHPEVVALLLRYGAQPLAAAGDGSTPLGVALQLGRQDLVDWLDWQQWPFPARRLRSQDLVNAAASGDVAAVDRLVALGLPLETRDGAGATALLRACGDGHLEVVRCLLEAGADPSASARSGATCLCAAVSQRHREIASALLDAGVDVDQPIPGGATALMVAAALGLPEMLQLLIERGAAVTRVDESGNQAIHALAQFGFTARERERAIACWNHLLRAENADAVNHAGLSPLLLLLGARADSGHPLDERCLAGQLELLLKQQPDLDRRDSRGFGPLHLCALHGHLASLPSLLAAGAGRDARDALNRTPQDIAVMRGFVDLAADLAPPAAPGTPSIARFLRDPKH